ncbi:MAG: CotH kinase family protein [Paludibacteraceae bacterium]
MKRLALLAWGVVCSLTLSAVSYSGTLPVLFVNTENGADITDKETYLSATYYLDPMGDPAVAAFGSEESPLPLQIRGRGNWTWSGFEKKPYRLKLNSKAALLGMKANKHFALLAHADDPHGFMRNTVGFFLSERFELPWTPAQRPVELVLNGDYRGIYFLTELIRVDKDRVDITEQEDLCTNPDSVTGGWLVEIDNYDTDPHITITEGDGRPIIFTYKTPEVLSAAQADFLTAEMTRLNTLIYGDKQSDELWRYLDMEDLARFFLVQELADNYESFHGSCYLYREMGETEKWHFGPVWDFGSSLNNSKTQPFYEGREHHNTWAPQLAQFPAFQAKLKELWERYSVDFTTDLDACLQDFVASIEGAVANDAERWKSQGYGNADLQQDLQHVRQFMRNAAVWESNRLGISSTEPTITVRWRPIPEWTDTQTAFVWGDGGEPRFVMPTRVGDYYQYVTAAAYLNILFVNGTNWTTHDNQTVDINDLIADACYEVLETTATQAPDNGKREVKAIDCSLTPVESTYSASDVSPCFRKVLRNGQLILFRNGQAYSVLGNPVAPIGQ